MSVERKKVLILCLYVNNVKVLIGDGHSLLQLHLLWVTGYFQNFSLLTYKQRSILFAQSFVSQFHAKRCSHLLQWAKVVWRVVDWTLFSWTRFSNFVSGNCQTIIDWLLGVMCSVASLQISLASKVYLQIRSVVWCPRIYSNLQFFDLVSQLKAKTL